MENSIIIMVPDGKRDKKCKECAEEIKKEDKFFVFFALTQGKTPTPYREGPFHNWECARIARDRGPIIK